MPRIPNTWCHKWFVLWWPTLIHRCLFKVSQAWSTDESSVDEVPTRQWRVVSLASEKTVPRLQVYLHRCVFLEKPAPKSSNCVLPSFEITRISLTVWSEVLWYQGEHAAMFVSMHQSKLMEFVQELGMFEQVFVPSRESRPHPHSTSRATNDTSSAMRGLRGFPMQNSGGADSLDRSIKLLVMQFLLMQT